MAQPAYKQTLKVQKFITYGFFRWIDFNELLYRSGHGIISSSQYQSKRSEKESDKESVANKGWTLGQGDKWGISSVLVIYSHSQHFYQSLIFTVTIIGSANHA